MIRRSLFLVLFLTVLATGALARTITVARDGTGEYMILQHALDAAADGDTVLLGPGEYTEMFPVKFPGYPWDVDVAGHVTASELTIIGAGPESTFVGQTTADIDRDHYSPISLVWEGGTICRVSDLTMRNSFDGFQAVNGPVDVHNCFFQENVRGFVSVNIGWGGRIGSSTFSTTQTSLFSTIYFTGTGGGVTIEDCDVTLSESWLGIEINNVQEISVIGCNLTGLKNGFQIGGGASCLIDDCTITDIDNIGVNMSPSSARCEIRDSEISGGNWAVQVKNEGFFSATGTVFQGGAYGGIQLFGCQPASLRHCDLLKGSSKLMVDCTSTETSAARHDFRGNYWGTDDPDLIAEWIWDWHDDPVSAYAEVLFTPFATGETDLVVSLSPIDPQIVIPEAGGTFQYDATLENNTADDIIADVIFEAEMPDGTVYPVMTFPGQIVPASQVKTRLGLNQTVPAGAPSGAYTYRVSVSLAGSILIDSAEFPFEKEGAVQAGAVMNKWELSGWEDDQAPPVKVPGSAILHAPAPNPFNPTTAVAFELPSQQAVSLLVFDLQGRLVSTLIQGEAYPQGRHEAVWDGRDDAGRLAASGTYVFRLEAGGHGVTKRAVLIK